MWVFSYHQFGGLLYPTFVLSRSSVLFIYVYGYLLCLLRRSFGGGGQGVDVFLVFFLFLVGEGGG